MRILGHEFRQMTAADYEGLAGADDGSWICELEDTVLIWTPADKVSDDGRLITALDGYSAHGVLSELYNGGESQRDWTASVVM